MLRIKHLLITASLLTTLLIAATPPSLADTTTEVCSTTGLPATIPNPDPNGGTNDGVTNDIIVTDTGIISNVRLTKINVTHGLIGEISASVTHGGKTVIIGSDPGVVAVTSPQGCKGKNLSNLIISDAGTKSIEMDCTTTDPAYNSSYQYRPKGHLFDFNGDGANGTWSLKLVDGYNYDTVAGTLNGWCVEYTRPTISTFTMVPVNGTILNLGTVSYPSVGTQYVEITAGAGDDIQISEVKFLTPSPTTASNDFTGKVDQLLPTPAQEITGGIKYNKAYNTPIILKPGGKYRFSAECKPTGTGTRTATFQIATNLPAPYDVLSFPLTCDGKVALYSATNNAASIAPDGTIDMGGINLSTTSTNSDLTITNLGNLPLTLSGSFASASGTSANISLQGTFSTTLPANGSLLIPVQCTPTTGGVRTRVLTISLTDVPNLSSVSYTFKCTGNAPVASFNPSINSANSYENSFNVGTATTGFNDVTNKISITNVGAGTTALQLSSPQIINNTSGAFSVDSSVFPLSINAGATKKIPLICNGKTKLLSTGSYTAKFTVDTNDSNVNSATFDLSCTIIDQKSTATLTPASNSTLDFNTVGSSGGVLPITISNSGSATKALTVKVSGSGFSGTGAAAFALLDQRGEVIDVTAAESVISIIEIGLSNKINLQCKGAVGETYTATLTLATDDLSNPTISYPVTCTVASNDNYPLYHSNPVSGSTIDLGSAQVGSATSSKTIRVSEIGNADLKVALVSSDLGDFSIALPSGTDFPFIVGNNSGEVIDINVKCTPSSVGDRTATLKLQATDTSGNLVALDNYPSPTYDLSCKGLVPKYSSTPVPPGTIDLGDIGVGTSSVTTVKISNLIDLTTLTIDSYQLSGANTVDFSVSGLPVDIKGIKTTNMTVTCEPTGLGPRTATLQLKNNDPDQPVVTYTLNCNGKSGSNIIYGSDPPVVKNGGTWEGKINFGDVPITSSSTQTLTISELGSIVLNVGKADPLLTVVTGDNSITVDATVFVDDATHNGINPGFYIPDGGSSKTVTLTCQPTSAGLHTATLKLRTDDSDASKSTVSYILTCHGIKSGYSSTPAPASTLNCGGATTQTGTHATETIRVMETGEVNLVVNSADFSGTNASDFSILSPSFPFTLTNGSTAQDIQVQFTPTAAGTRTATLTLSSNDPDNSSIAYHFSCQTATPPSTEVVLQKTLAIMLNPNDGGKVDSSFGDIHCGEGMTACRTTFGIDTDVGLTVTPVTGYQFKAWSGDCTTNSIVLNTDKTCTANFELLSTTEKPPVEPETPVTPGTPTVPSVVQPPVVPPVIQPPVVQPPVTPPTTNPGETEGSQEQSIFYTLSVSTSGKGSGKISGSGINCGDGGNGQCNQTVDAHTQMTLSAQPLSGSIFLGWSGSCEGKTALVSLNMIEHKQCVARFELLATQPEKEDDGLGNYCTGNGYTNISCNARGAVIGDIDGKIEVDTGGYLANGIVTKPLTNKGWVANLTIEDTGSLTGGIVTGTIVNNGEMSHFEFRGDMLSGGKLSGIIKNNSPNVCFTDGIIRGVIKNVTLAANTRILGGRLSGEIKGDSQSPAHLANVIVTGKTTLSNVILEENVSIEQDVLHETTQMTQVKLAPNLKMQGGRISGILSGDVTAPAHLSNMLINAGTTLENVILDDNIEIADENVCANQVLAATTSQDTPETATTENNAILLNSEGNQLDSTTRFDTQLITSQGKRPNKAVLSPEAAKTVDLAVHLTVQREHVGTAAELLIVVQTKNTEQTMNYMKTATGWTLWDGQLSHLQPLETYQKLPEIIDLSVFTGDLSRESGEFSLYAGYRLSNGTLVFNGRNPLRFAVTRTVEACALTCGCQ
jgi:hypothetical protein